MICQNCKEEISETDVFCRYCGQKNVPKEEEKEVASPEPVLVKKCISCGKLYQQDAKFCVDCGSQLAQEPVAPIAEPSKEQGIDEVTNDNEEVAQEIACVAEKAIINGTLCSQCGAIVPDQMQFCGKCGTKVVIAKKEIFCTGCGTAVEDGMLFCGKCGTKVTESGSKNPVVQKVEVQHTVIKEPVIKEPVTMQTVTKQSPSPTYTEVRNDFNNYRASSIENELYSKNNVGYYKGPIQIAGLFIVTNKKISYTPSAIYVLYKPFTIDMNEVLNAERASVMGINLCIRITTTSGKAHTFALGIMASGDIDRVVEIINNAKQYGRR